MKKLALSLAAVFMFLLFSHPVRAVDLRYDTGKTYGTTAQHVVIEIPAEDSVSTARNVYNLFAVSRPYLKITKPSAQFPASPAFPIYDSIAGGWYLTLPPEAGTNDIVSSFTSRTSRPVVVEITPYDAAFISALHGKFPGVRIHTAQYLFWPRSDAKNAFTQTPPPTLEAVSIRLEETDQSNLFGTFKTIFDTMFDASNDVAGGSGVKMNYPANAKLAISDISPRWSEDAKNSAFRFGVAGGAVVAYLESRGKASNAPIEYIGLGKYAGMTDNARNIAARFAKFISLSPNIIWPMAVAGNGDPYDNTFFAESNSKPITGVLGLVQGAPEGIIINESGNAVPVSLPGSPAAAAYSSLTGAYEMSASIQMGPGETIIFGNNSTDIRSSSPPPAAQPTAVPTTAAPTSPPVPTTPPSLPTTGPGPVAPTTASPTSPPTPTIQYFPMGGFQITPPVPVSFPGSNPNMARLKTGLRLLVVKTNPLLQAAGSMFIAVTRYDRLLENYINSTLTRLIAPFRRP